MIFWYLLGPPDLGDADSSSTCSSVASSPTCSMWTSSFSRGALLRVGRLRFLTRLLKARENMAVGVLGVFRLSVSSLSDLPAANGSTWRNLGRRLSILVIMLLERGGWSRLEVAEDVEEELERMRPREGTVEVGRRAASFEGRGRSEVSEVLRPVRLMTEGLPEKMTETTRANSPCVTRPSSDSSLSESNESRSERSSAEDDPSSSDDRYTR